MKNKIQKDEMLTLTKVDIAKSIADKPGIQEQAPLIPVETAPETMAQALPTKAVLQDADLKLKNVRLAWSFYIPVPSARAFRHEKSYDKIDWKNFREVLNEFHGRMDDWYIIPAKELGKNGHFAFPVMAMDCLLIDTLSQYYYGTTRPRLKSRIARRALSNLRAQSSKTSWSSGCHTEPGHFLCPSNNRSRARIPKASRCSLTRMCCGQDFGAEFCIRLTSHSTALLMAWRTCWTFKPAASPSMPTAATVQP